jgi:hypothetical protein
VRRDGAVTLRAQAIAAEGHGVEAGAAMPAGGVLVRARIVPAAGRARAALERVWPLSPYALETIALDARRAGPGSHVELVVVSRGGEAALEENLARLLARGVCISVRRSAGRRSA